MAKVNYNDYHLCGSGSISVWQDQILSMSAPFHATAALTPTCWSLCLVQISWAEGRSQSSYEGRGRLVELLSKIPKSIFYQTQEAEDSAGGGGRGP